MRLTATGCQGHDRIVDFRLFHSRMIRPAGRGPDLSETTEKRQKKKELSTKGHEERRRATKALRLTATGCQGHERIIDFRLFHSRMIRPAGRGRDLSETKPVSLSNDPPRRGGRGPTCLKQNLFHPRMIRPVVWGGACLRSNTRDNCCRRLRGSGGWSIRFQWLAPGLRPRLHAAAASRLNWSPRAGGPKGHRPLQGEASNS